MTEPAAALDVAQLVKIFTSDGTAHRVVDGVSFSVEPGAFYSLLGPSGCGKTTTLRCVAGLEHVDGGQISIAGKVVAGGAREVPPERRDYAMVFQNYAIWPHLSVFENVAFPLRVQRTRVRKAELSSRVEEALALVRLEHLAQRPATQLSGGQQQRLALARALVRRPTLLLLDEPLSNLDLKLREQMRTELRELQRRLGVTTLYVTHDQGEALSMSNRIAVLQHGKIVQEGTAREIYQRPKSRFVADFVGRTNFIEAEAVGRGEGSLMQLRALGQLLTVRCPGDVGVGDRVTLSIRPELIRIHRSAPDAANVVAGTIDRVEFLGEHIETMVSIDGANVTVRQDSLETPCRGDQLWLELRPDACTVITEAGMSIGDDAHRTDATGTPPLPALA